MPQFNSIKKEKKLQNYMFPYNSDQINFESAQADEKDYEFISN